MKDADAGARRAALAQHVEPDDGGIVDKMSTLYAATRRW
jgi:hypothetical protein